MPNLTRHGTFRTQDPPPQKNLYNLGVEADDDPISDSDPTITAVLAPYSPLVLKHIPHNSWKVPHYCWYLHLPLQCTFQPNPIANKAAWVGIDPPDLPPRCFWAITLPPQLLMNTILDEKSYGNNVHVFQSLLWIIWWATQHSLFWLLMALECRSVVH